MYEFNPLVAQLNLPEKQSLVWTCLWTFQGQNEDCFPSLQAISERLGGAISPKAISKHIQALSKSGWLRIVRRGFGRSNRYTVLVPDDILFKANFSSKKGKSATVGEGAKRFLGNLSNPSETVPTPKKQEPVWNFEPKIQRFGGFDPEAEARADAFDRAVGLGKYANQSVA